MSRIGQRWVTIAYAVRLYGERGITLHSEYYNAAAALDCMRTLDPDDLEGVTSIDVVRGTFSTEADGTRGVDEEVVGTRRIKCNC